MRLLLFLFYPILVAGTDVQVGPCKFFNDVHGLVDVCAPYMPTFKAYRVYIASDNMGTFSEDFGSIDEAEAYAKEFEITVDQWTKVYYTDLYRHNYTIEIKPVYDMELNSE